MVAVSARPEAGYSYPPPSNRVIANVGSTGIANRGISFTSVSNSHLNVGGHSNRYHSNPVNFQVPLIHKHIYVHVPPPETEIQRRPTIAPVAPSQKHYKIIFIKTPSAQAPSSPTLPALTQNREKTLIYVLVKRPEDAPSISIPTAKPTRPSKPEVYFIRYKTQKEISSSQEVIPDTPFIPGVVDGAPGIVLSGGAGGAGGTKNSPGPLTMENPNTARFAGASSNSGGFAGFSGQVSSGSYPDYHVPTGSYGVPVPGVNHN